MRVNIYAEETTNRVEIVTKEIDGNKFTGLRFYLELPTSYRMVGPLPQPLAPGDNGGRKKMHNPVRQIKGPFKHRPGDDDSSAVTFWGKRDLRVTLRKALVLLDEHYAAQDRSRG